MKYLPEKLRKDLLTKIIIKDNITIGKASIQIGVPTQTITRIEKGLSCNLVDFAKICTWLGTKPNDYFEIIGKRQDGIKSEREPLHTLNNHKDKN